MGGNRSKIAFLFVLLVLAVSGVLAVAGELRIVSLLPNLTEIAYELGLGDQLVGVSDFDNYPPEVAQKPKVGGMINTNYEVVLALRPSLVLLDKRMGGHITKFEQLGVKTLPTRVTTLAEIYTAIHRIGQATGRTEQARKLDARLRAEFKEVEAINAGRPKVRTLLVIGHDPGTLQAAFAAARGTWHDDLLALAGGINCLDRELVYYPQVSKEVVIKSNPQCILVFAPGVDGSPLGQQRERALWAKLGSIEAVKKGQVHLLTDDCVQKPGPRMPAVARMMAQRLRKVD